ncbi:hypothetical protein BsWGS_25128 [Bradybaena similaris]
MFLRSAFLCSLLTTVLRAEDCRPTYFGEGCKFKCHCKRGLCDQRGQCPENLCQEGFFGRKCQNVDLLFHESSLSNPYYLYDQNEETCNPDPEEQLVTLDLSRPVILYWIRVFVNKPFGNNQGIPYLKITVDRSGECANRQVYLGRKFMDITCTAILMFKITLEGKIVGNLCSVYFSGGRNIAIGQAASQSSTWHNDAEKAGASNAVDGNINNDFEATTSCTRTNPEPKGPTWSVTFDKPHIIFRVTIILDKDEEDELGGFQLSALNSAGVVVYSYQHDNNETEPIINVMPFPQEPISSMSILQTANVSSRVLVLCEFQVFAETDCPPGLFGLSCKNECPCQFANMCRAATGLCMAQEILTVLLPETAHNVSSTECPNGTYGTTCNMTCPTYCVGPTCDKETGYCDECQKSHTGAKCEECASIKYGPACSLNCPEGCLDPCDDKTGQCVSCKEPYFGPKCDKNARSRILSMTVAIIIACLTIFFGVSYFIRKNKKKDADSESASSATSDDSSSI